eukprot:CAMPEP_0202867040 /NCGR_PEP_ID=MMETSP1391-20130828/8545_1 /ASSEMBLY_ACC=CAM_ASM_000867 /TAXON_ID=1034604 /ORGANISM="Chlamydomonas leiostraca, Strain SAG 11-49" /LENGTH=569 /DNA_ID=CAMNT_0049547043 /DNA_START=38 /DNA_END=1747 /DNA_ORIENTATION=-
MASLSFWLKNLSPWHHHGTRHASPPQELQADVVICGAGISGASLAYHLRNLRPELKVVVVEARGVSGGATGRNGGLMWPGLNAPWPETIQKFGKDGAAKLMTYEMHAFQDIAAFVKGREDACAFSFFPEGGLTLFESEEEARVMLADTALQAEAGFPHVSIPVPAHELPQRLHSSTTAFVGGLRHPVVGRVTAARIVHELLREALDRPAGAADLAVLQHSAVTSIQALPEGGQAGVAAGGQQGGAVGEVWTAGAGMGAGGAAAMGVAAARAGAERCTLPPKLRVSVMPTSDSSDTPAGGLTIMCGAFVHATNGYNKLLPSLRDSGWLVPVRNQVAVTQPLPRDHPLPHASFSTRDGYVYFSRRADDRVVIGGFRDVVPHREVGTYDDTLVGLDPHVSACLRTYLPTAFPDLFTISAASGKSGSSSHAADKAAKRVAGLSLHELQAVPTKGSDHHHHGHSHGHGHGRGHGAAPVELQYELEWSGILGFTKDRWPLVGVLPAELSASGGAQNAEYACMGFTGHGMTRCFNCAKNLALMLAGEPTEQVFPATVFSPARVLVDSKVSLHPSKL